MNRGRKVGLAVLALLIAFLAGFVPQWVRVQAIERELTEARVEVRRLELGTQLGAALAESQRGNYERARQLMAGFFTALEPEVRQMEEPAQIEELDALMSQRDEIITLLSRAEPESTSRLNLMFTRYFAATHPLGREAPTTVTPSPPP